MSSTVKICKECKQDVPVRENGTAVQHFVIKSDRGRKVRRLCPGSDRPA